MEALDPLVPVLESVGRWLAGWLPWAMLFFAIGCVGIGMAGLDDESDVGRDFFLLAIAVTLLMIGFVLLLRV